MDISQTLDFLANLCEHAESARRIGDRVPLIELGRQPATAHYYANVVKLAALSPEQWAQQFPQLVAQADALRVRAEAVVAQAIQLELQAEQIAALKSQIEHLITVKQRESQAQKGALAPAYTSAEEDQL